MEKKGSIDMYAEDPILPDEIGSKKSRRLPKVHLATVMLLCHLFVLVPRGDTILWNSAGPIDFVH